MPALIRRGLRLEYVTLGWNVAGSVVLLAAAIRSGSVALSGFAVDSMIEIVASVVVVRHLRAAPDPARDRRALRVIAVAFGLLAVYIASQVVVAVASGARSGQSTAGIIWVGLTVATMVVLAAAKQATGRLLGNPVLTAEARVTFVDAGLAGAVLTGLTLHAIAGWSWADPACATAILVYAAREAPRAWRDAG